MREPPINDAAPGATGAGVQVSNVTPDSINHPTPEGTVSWAWIALGSTREGDAWITPERNAEGEVTGHAIRPDKGNKTSRKGSTRGLTLKWPLPPYAGTTPEDPVFIVEGASDAAAGVGIGLDIVGRPGATGGKPLLAALLKQRHVCIIAENDAGAGQRGAVGVADALAGVCASVRIIDPPMGVKDLRVWVAAGGTRESILEAASVAPLHDPSKPAEPRTGSSSPPTANIVRLSDVSPEPVRWLWRGRIAIGKLTLIVGDPGGSKSFLTLDLAARVSTGRPMPDTPDETPAPGGVILLSAEDTPADTIRPRLDAAGADCERIVYLESVNRNGVKSTLDLSRDLDALRDAIDRTPDCRLVVIDPISAYLGGTESHKNADVRGMLAPLSALATERGFALVCVSHLNKNQGVSAIYRTTGSLAFAAAARAVWLVVKDNSDESRRGFLPIKNNIGKDTTGLAYSLVSMPGHDQPALQWESAPIETSADDALAADRGDDDRHSALDHACEFLRAVLAEGEMKCEDVHGLAEKAGISKSTLRRAFRAVDVHTRKSGKPGEPGAWWWSLPPEDAQPTPEDDQDAHAPGVDTFNDPEHLRESDADEWGTI